MQNVDARILFDRQHKALPRVDVHGVEPFHGELRHKAMLTKMLAGCVATFQKRHERDWPSRPGSVSSRHLEQVLDELNLSPNIRTAHPPRLPLPDHVHGLVALDGSPRRLKFTKPLLGLHASLDRSMILLHDVVQVLDRALSSCREARRLTPKILGSSPSRTRHVRHQKRLPAST